MKGVLHTLEVVISLAVILIAVAAMFTNAPKSDTFAVSAAQDGYAALQYLDYSGQLRPAAALKDVNAIRNAMPLSHDFNVEICDPDCSGTTRQGAVAMDYYVAGDQSFGPVHIRLYMWR